MIKEQLKSSFVYDWYDELRTVWRNFYYQNIVSDKSYISKHYRKVFNHDLNWDKPIDLNEKINWLKIYNPNSEPWTELSDKYRVREYVKMKGLEGILVPLYGHWDKAENIDFDALPNSFVMKTNHGSGGVLVVHDKLMLDKKKTIKDFKKALHQKFYGWGEPHYLAIKPCIIAEELLEQKKDTYTTSIVDYKIWCFDGKPAYVWACYSRSKESVYVEVRDLDWGYHPEKSVFTHHYRDGKGVVPKPKCMEEMLKIATKLSEGFKQVRVDLYEIEGKVYFGEMTFTSNGGYNDFYTQNFLNELGALIKI